MGVKDWFRSMQPMQLYIILILTILFFITELVVSHITHALTLLMDSYHMLCNILALTGCIITIKYGKQTDNKDDCDSKHSESSIPSSLDEEMTTETTAACRDKKTEKSSPSRANQEKKLKNTFGWTRIDVISMLICGVFLASLCFSIYVEALQTLVHISHQDEMHHPISVLCIGAAGLVLNGICYLLIGGYTFHQGSFLYVTESGDVILNKVVVNESVRKGERRLSRTKNIYSSPPPRQRQGCWEMLRDINGCIYVIICALTVTLVDHSQAKFIDPAFSLLSATSIMILSYPYIKESCFILLQTMPDTININCLKTELLQHFPDIVNVHDLHIWQLTASKVISTVHIIFQNPKVYNRIMEEVKQFFLENGITQVTIQPEFFTKSASLESLACNKLPPICLMACQEEGCKENHCCPNYEELSKFKSPSKEIIPLPENTTPTLKSVKILNDELPSLRSSISNFSINSAESKNFHLINALEHNTKLRNEINKSLNSLAIKHGEILENKGIHSDHGTKDQVTSDLIENTHSTRLQNENLKETTDITKNNQQSELQNEVKTSLNTIVVSRKEESVDDSDPGDSGSVQKDYRTEVRVKSSKNDGGGST